MRKIEFRGKKIYSGKWVFGKYIELPSGFGQVFPCILENDGAPNLVAFATVGQFIGLYDSNNRKIFEGDIVTYFDKQEDETERYVVVFTNKDVGSCGCCYEAFDGSGFVGENATGKRANLCSSKIVVIGNTFDGVVK